MHEVITGQKCTILILKGSRPESPNSWKMGHLLYIKWKCQILNELYLGFIVFWNSRMGIFAQHKIHLQTDMEGIRHGADLAQAVPWVMQGLWHEGPWCTWMCVLDEIPWFAGRDLNKVDVTQWKKTKGSTSGSVSIENLEQFGDTEGVNGMDQALRKGLSCFPGALPCRAGSCSSAVLCMEKASQTLQTLRKLHRVCNQIPRS